MTALNKNENLINIAINNAKNVLQFWCADIRTMV